MNVEDRFTTRETSEKLKAAGLSQEVQPSEGYWAFAPSRQEWKFFFQDEGEDNVSTLPYPWVKAFDAHELSIQLPPYIDCPTTTHTHSLEVRKSESGWNLTYGNHVELSEKNLAELFGKAILGLKEIGLWKPITN